MMNARVELLLSKVRNLLLHTFASLTLNKLCDEVTWVLLKYAYIVHPRHPYIESSDSLITPPIELHPQFT